MICPNCGGAGSAEHVICWMCRGTGDVSLPCVMCGEPAVEMDFNDALCAGCADRRRNEEDEEDEDVN